MPRYSYAIATGENVALDSLTNFETLFKPYWNPAREVAPTSLPVNETPVETELHDGSVRHDGLITHEMRWAVLPMAAIDKYIDDFFVVSGNRVSTRAVTANFRRYDRLIYARYNCLAVFPQSGVDYTEIQNGHAQNVRFRFRRLVRIV